MISVLMPTRERLKLATDSVRSLGEGDFEVLLYVDEDDPTDYTGLGKIFRGPRVGYKNFHLMINDLAKIARGDYLMLWNDDAIMMTRGWDEIIQTFNHPDIAVLNMDPNHLNDLFPVITRPMYETMGHFSLSTHCDSWVQDIANELGIHYWVPGIEYRHLREMVWDKIKEDSQGAYAITSPLHYSESMQKLMRQDEEKLRARLN